MSRRSNNKSHIAVTLLPTPFQTYQLEYLNIKYSEQKTSDLLDIASLLDTRFRASYIAKEKLEGLKCTAVQEAEALLRDQGGTSHELPGPAAEPQLDEPPAKKRKTLSSFFKKTTLS